MINCYETCTWLETDITDNPDWWEKEPSGRWKIRKCEEFSRLGGFSRIYA